jgi:hypothetical protein
MSGIPRFLLGSRLRKLDERGVHVVNVQQKKFVCAKETCGLMPMESLLKIEHEEIPRVLSAMAPETRRCVEFQNDVCTLRATLPDASQQH